MEHYEKKISFLGENIQTIRKHRGMKQQELADKIGINMQSLSKIERGVNYPIKNVSIPSLPEDVDIVVTHKSLTDRAIAVRPNAIHYSVENFLEGEQYDAIIKKIKETR